MQLKIHCYQTFRFSMPEELVGREDLTYIVEFVPMDGKVNYDVWCEISETNMRGFICSGKVKQIPGESGNNLIDRITSAFIQKKVAPATTGDWIRFVSECCAGDPDDEED